MTVLVLPITTTTTPTHSEPSPRSPLSTLLKIQYVKTSTAFVLKLQTHKTFLYIFCSVDF